MNINNKILLSICGLVAVLLIAGIVVGYNFVFGQTKYSKIYMETTKTVSENLATSPDTVSFEKFIQAAGYDSLLSNGEKYTVFAPNNDAVSQVPGDYQDFLLEETSKPVLQEFAGYHIVKGEYYYEDMKDGMELESLTGEKILIRRSEEGGILIGNYAYITLRDIGVKNGVIHLVDRVLIPKSQIASSDDGQGELTSQ